MSIQEQRGAAMDKQDRAQQLHDELKAGIEALTTSEDWQKALDQAAKFHHYSFGNQWLIAFQRPEASLVAGYKRWQELGRHVRKGEHGIAILAPMKCSRTVERQDGTEERVSFLRGFRVVHVFDVSQTEGEDLALDALRPSLLEGSEPEGLWAALERFASVKVDREECGSANGFFDGSRIVVRPDLEGAQACKTLAHEIAHSILHADLDAATRDRGRAEVEAESAAYIVLRACGVEADGYSFPYVASWASGQVKTVTETAERVIATARQILDGIGQSQSQEQAA